MLSLQTTDSVTASPSPSELSPLHTQGDSPFPAGCPVPLLAAGNSILLVTFAPVLEGTVPGWAGSAPNTEI